MVTAERNNLLLQSKDHKVFKDVFDQKLLEHDVIKEDDGIGEATGKQIELDEE